MSRQPGPARGATLRERALRLLARRDYARAELRARLTALPRQAMRKAGQNDRTAAHLDADNTGSATDIESASDALESLLDSLQQSGLLSDERYATQRAGGRGQRLGNARLAHELRTKGVDAAIIEGAIHAAGDETARARAVWQKKFGAAPTSRDAWAKQARFLQARGFSSATIRAVMRDCETPQDCEDLEALDESDSSKLFE